MTYADILIFAKTWGMAYLAVVFLVAVSIVYRPGSKKQAERNGKIPLHKD